MMTDRSRPSMSPVEQLLHARLEHNPEDWEARLDLATQRLHAGAVGEARTLVAGATSAPASADQLRRALDFFAGHPVGGHWRHILERFLDENEGSAIGMAAYARVLFDEGFPTEARHYYRAAIAIHPALGDPGFEHRLRDAEQTAETAVPAGDPDPGPSEPPPAPAPSESPEEGKGPAGGPAKDPSSAGDSTSPALSESQPPTADHGEESHLITVEGEKVEAADRESDTPATLTALSAALVLHFVMIGVFTFWAIAQPRQPPPQITASSPQEATEERPRPKREKRPPDMPSSSASTMAVSALSTSALALPEPTTPEFTGPVAGFGDSFGASMNFGSGNGMATFFGSSAKAQKVVFVVDASASMVAKDKSGKTRFQLMQEELKRSIQSLSPGVKFQVIFFAGPAWFLGDEVDRTNWRSIGGGAWEYKDGDPRKLPVKSYIVARPSRIRVALDQIDKTEPVLGTDWRSPLKMAMNLEPDLIFFMTDGTISDDSGKPVVGDVLDYNRKKSGAKINCISLMEPQAYKMMDELARKSRGDMTLVLGDGSVLRGSEIERHIREN